MELITIAVILFTWIGTIFLPNYEKEYEFALEPTQTGYGRSIIHNIISMPLLAIGLMYLLKNLFGDGGVIFIFSVHLLFLLLLFISSIYWWNQYKAAMNESLSKAEKYFNQFPWDEVEHAYGKANDSPDYLYALIDEDNDARDDAVYDFLYAAPWHQYSVYSSTPYAIKCVQYIIQNVDISGLKVGKNPLLFDLMNFINLCTHGAQNDEELKKSIIEGKSIYRDFQNHPNLKTREKAVALVKFCC